MRTRLIDAAGLPAPFNRPVEPRTTSIRSYSAVSSPSALKSLCVGTPSTCMLVTSMPRAYKPFSLSSADPFFLKVSPGVLAMASSSVLSPWSDKRWRVITDTDCGVSRKLIGSLVAVVDRPTVYESVPSLGPGSREPRTSTGASVCADARRTP
ncbi:hypothetical protein D3C72_1651760 [compost metagenome]